MDTSLIIDCDGHLVEAPDLWERYIEGDLKQKAPRLVKDRKGQTRLLLEGRLYPQPEGKGKGFPGFFEHWFRFENGRAVGEKAISPGSRLEAMDTDGIDIAVPFPTLGLYTVDARDAELNAAICRAYNDWLFQEYLAADRARLVGAAMIALVDVGEAVKELRRAVTELGFRAAFVRPNPVHGRTLDDSAYDPLYAAAQDLGVPLMFHEGTDGQIPTAGLDRYDNFFMTHMISHPFEQMLAALSVIAGGVLERFPRLKVAFLESGCAWLPFWLHRMDEHWEKRAHEVPWLRMKPSEYFRRQCMISCDPDEATIPAVVHYIGEDYVCWASDYPHWDAIFPGAVAELRKHLNGLSEAAQQKILGDNARRFLDLDAGSKIGRRQILSNR
jgi:predicted TIM-barrel fold metal-dependent hydrolase